MLYTLIVVYKGNSFQWLICIAAYQFQVSCKLLRIIIINHVHQSSSYIHINRNKRFDNVKVENKYAQGIVVLKISKR